jgi:hypothetical protein
MCRSGPAAQPQAPPPSSAASLLYTHGHHWSIDTHVLTQRPLNGISAHTWRCARTRMACRPRTPRATPGACRVSAPCVPMRMPSPPLLSSPALGDGGARPKLACDRRLRALGRRLAGALCAVSDRPDALVSLQGDTAPAAPAAPAAAPTKPATTYVGSAGKSKKSQWVPYPEAVPLTFSHPSDTSSNWRTNRPASDRNNPRRGDRGAGKRGAPNAPGRSGRRGPPSSTEYNPEFDNEGMPAFECSIH